MAKPSMWFCRVGLTVVLAPASAAFASAAFAGSAAASTASLCKDADQLQSWIAQKFRPGMDQYNLLPGRSLPAATTDAQYLQNLSADTPPAVQAEFNVWISFTQQVGEGAGPALTASGLNAAETAAEHVSAWFATQSGCPNHYAKAGYPDRYNGPSAVAAPRSSSSTSHDNAKSTSNNYATWIVVGLFAVALLVGSGIQRTPERTDGRPIPDRQSLSA